MSKAIPLVALLFALWGCSGGKIPYDQVDNDLCPSLNEYTSEVHFYPEGGGVQEFYLINKKIDELAVELNADLAQHSGNMNLKQNTSGRTVGKLYHLLGQHKNFEFTITLYDGKRTRSKLSTREPHTEQDWTSVLILVVDL